MSEESCGRTVDGASVTDEMIGRLADEAEQGYDVEQIQRRRRGGRPLGSADASPGSTSTVHEVLERAGRRSGGRIGLADAAEILREERDAR